MRSKNIKLICIVLTLFCIKIAAYAQNLNYALIKDSFYTLSCETVDSLTIVNTKNKLEAFDTNLISSNIEMYYHDLGMCYYKMYLITKDTTFLQQSSITYDKALSHNPTYSAALWEKTFYYYFFLKDCQKGKYYLDRYKKATKRKYWQKEQIKRITYNCNK